MMTTITVYYKPECAPSWAMGSEGFTPFESFALIPDGYVQVQHGAISFKAKVESKVQDAPQSQTVGIPLCNIIQWQIEEKE